MHTNYPKRKIAKRILLSALTVFLFGSAGGVCWVFSIVYLDFYVGDEYTIYMLLGTLLCIMIPVTIGLYIVTSKILGEDQPK